jgi:hypothetical protein
MTTEITLSFIPNPDPSPRIKSDNPVGGKVDPSKYTNRPSPWNKGPSAPELRGK